MTRQNEAMEWLNLEKSFITLAASLSQNDPQ